MNKHATKRICSLEDFSDKLEIYRTKIKREFGSTTAFATTTKKERGKL